MRASRLLVAVLAFALLGLVSTSSAASVARAHHPSASPGATRLTTAQPVAARAVTKLTAKVVKRKGGKLFLTGVIRPKKGPVVIQKATSCNRKKGTCNFKDTVKRKITKKGRYTARIYAPRTGSWAYRAKKDKKVSVAWITCLKKPGDKCPMP